MVGPESHCLLLGDGDDIHCPEHWWWIIIELTSCSIRGVLKKIEKPSLNHPKNHPFSGGSIKHPSMFHGFPGHLSGPSPPFFVPFQAETLEVAPFAVPLVVDGTAAGDAFRAALAVAIGEKQVEPGPWCRGFCWEISELGGFKDFMGTASFFFFRDQYRRITSDFPRM